MTDKQQGQHSKRGQSLLLDLRDRTFVLLKEGNVDEGKAQQISNELVIVMAQNWGGQLLYITKADGFLADERDIQIYKEFNGHNHAELALKYDLSVTWVYRIVKRMTEMERKRNQPDLFG